MDYLLHIGILICLRGILAISLNYIAGYTGIMSLSHLSFAGVGAYATAVLMKNFEFSFLGAIPLALILTAIIAFLASIPILKLKDDSLMLVSFGFALIMYNLMLNLSSLTNGALGIKGVPSAVIAGVNFFDKSYFFLLCLFILILCFLFFRKIVSSPYGTVLKGIRENESVTQNSGHNTKYYKYSVFVLAAVFAGLEGALFATYNNYIEPSLFNLLPSVMILIMIIFGGLASMRGAILAVIILTLAEEGLRFIGLPSSIMAETRQILYGLLLFALIYFRPQGLLGEYKV